MLLPSGSQGLEEKRDQPCRQPYESRRHQGGCTGTAHPTPHPPPSLSKTNQSLAKNPNTPLLQSQQQISLETLSIIICFQRINKKTNNKQTQRKRTLFYNDNASSYLSPSLLSVSLLLKLLFYILYVCIYTIQYNTIK